MEIRTIAWAGYCLSDGCITCSGSETPCSGTGYYADANFLDTGYNMLSFLGEEYSSFDQIYGIWVDGSNRARTSDLAMAVANRYSLEWNDRDHPNWVGNIIDYIRTYDEEAKRFRVYKPSITPIENVNNPELVIKDELDETQLRGLQILISSGIDSASDGSLGIIMDFR